MNDVPSVSFVREPEIPVTNQLFYRRLFTEEISSSRN